MGARCRKERRNSVKKDKEEKRRLGRERAAESYARRRTFAEFHNADVAIEVNPTPVGLMEVEEKEEMEEDTFHGAPPDAKRNVNDLV